MHNSIERKKHDRHHTIYGIRAIKVLLNEKINIVYIQDFFFQSKAQKSTQNMTSHLKVCTSKRESESESERGRYNMDLSLYFSK